VHMWFPYFCVTWCELYEIASYHRYRFVTFCNLAASLAMQSHIISKPRSGSKIPNYISLLISNCSPSVEVPYSTFQELHHISII
jgi:hypothetical protein